MTYLVGIAELLCGTDAGGAKRRRDRGSCQGTLHCDGVLKRVYGREVKGRMRQGITVGFRGRSGRRNVWWVAEKRTEEGKKFNSPLTAETEPKKNSPRFTSGGPSSH